MSMVSVVVPTHNRAGVLPRALRSIYAQKMSVDEVIVVDDGSTDDTAEQVGRHFPDVQLIVQSNHGVSHARNRGLQRARGTWVALLDSDDEWLPDKIQIQLNELKSSPALRVCHTNEIWIRNGRRVNPMKKHDKHGGNIFYHCLPRCVMSPSSILLHRSVIEEFGGFDTSLPVCEDYDLWLRITAHMDVLYIPEKLVVKHGGHADQLSRRFWGIDRYRIQALENLVCSGTLSGVQTRAVIKEMLRKIDIYVSGAQRRDRVHEVRRYAEKRVRYEQVMKKRSSSDRTMVEAACR